MSVSLWILGAWILSVLGGVAGGAFGAHWFYKRGLQTRVEWAAMGVKDVQVDQPEAVWLDQDGREIGEGG